MAEAAGGGSGAALFGLPPGVDFARELLNGLHERFADAADPLAMGRVLVLVNTARMARRLEQLLASGPVAASPRIHLVTRLPPHPCLLDLPPAVPPLERRLQLATLVGRLLEREPDLAPRSALYDLADSLAALFEEMSGEGVASDTLEALRTDDQSGHWERALKFLRLAAELPRSDAGAGVAPDPEARRRMAVQRLAAFWRDSPPDHPVVVAGSTGSRGTTLELMAAVARLPQGAVVLPGFDFDMDCETWNRLEPEQGWPAEDHPQFRFRRLMSRLDLAPGDVRPWVDVAPPVPERNRLVSLALRPAPYTDSWLREGPRLEGLDKALAGVTLVEAESQRDEALTIAFKAREALEAGRHVALITPDRILARRVTAALQRWDVLPDDSAGIPLHHSAPGRFLRLVARLLAGPPDCERLMEILKHPLTHGGGGRNTHLLATRRLELALRENGIAHPRPKDLRKLLAARGGKDREQPVPAAEQHAPDEGLDEGLQAGPGRAGAAAQAPGPEEAAVTAWVEWVGRCCLDVAETSVAPLSDWVARHRALAEALAGGSSHPAQPAGTLWEAAAGRAVRLQLEGLAAAAPAAVSPLSAEDYATLFEGVLSRGEGVRDPRTPDPRLRILGTLEARVNDADLVIVGSLNEGTWPEQPPPDPWLSRALRREAGLLQPERQIGLAAHDFQQAIAAREVWLTRATRTEQAETVPSRWLARLIHLLEGLGANGGAAALEAARRRGAQWCDLARRAEAAEPVPPEPRPSPRPPVPARPRQLSVTQISTLRRDPYAIYARKVLRLRKLPALVTAPDVRLRGIAIHKIFETFIARLWCGDAGLSEDDLMKVTEDVLAASAPWAVTRMLWRARVRRVAPWFLEGEEQRQKGLVKVFREVFGSLDVPEVPGGFTLVAKADRIDIGDDGKARLWDYKTGKPPSVRQQKAFDPQLLLEAMMVEAGAFAEVGRREVEEAAFIGLGNPPAIVPAPLDPETPELTREKLVRLVNATLDPAHGFTARRAMEKVKYEGDYDHLARFGEWSEADEPQMLDLGESGERGRSPLRRGDGRGASDGGSDDASDGGSDGASDGAGGGAP